MRTFRTTTGHRPAKTTTTRHHGLRPGHVDTSLVPAGRTHAVSFVPWDEPMARELDTLLADLSGLDRLDAEITRLERLESALAAEAN